MRRLALIAAAGIALVGCGSSRHASSPPPLTTHYPVVIHSPLVVAARAQLGDHLPRLVSPTRLAIAWRGSGSCPWVPDEITVQGPHAIRIDLVMGGWSRGRLVTQPLPNGCTMDLRTTPMLVAINPKQVDVHRPLTVGVSPPNTQRPYVETAAPLRS